MRVSYIFRHIKKDARILAVDQYDSKSQSGSVFVFNVPLTAMVIWRQSHGLKSHMTDWCSQGSNHTTLVYKACYLCFCMIYFFQTPLSTIKPFWVYIFISFTGCKYEKIFSTCCSDTVQIKHGKSVLLGPYVNIRQNSLHAR